MGAAEVERLQERCAERPLDPRAWGELGLAHKRDGRLKDAIEAYRASLALEPAQPPVCANLGRALREAGDLDGAIEAFKLAVAHDPSFARAYSMLSNALRERGLPAEALACAERALALEPTLAEAHLNAGTAMHVLGQLADAAVYYVLSHGLAPSRGTGDNFARAHTALARAHNSDELPGGPVLERALAIGVAPGEAADWQALGQELFVARRGPAAAAAFAVAHARRADATNLLMQAVVARHTGRAAEAEALLRSGLELEPKHPGCLGGLASMLVHEGRFSAARPLLARALEVSPDSPALLLDESLLLRELGEHEQSTARMEKALTLAPDNPRVHSFRLFYMHDTPHTPEELFRAHVAYGERFGGKVRQQDEVRAPGTERRLRVGYVSADFRAHAVAHYIEPVLAVHDRDQYDVYLYSDVAIEDEMTARFRAGVPNYRATSQLADHELAALIRADAIDVLVDVGGHTSGGRLPVFALRPAPVQVSWLGYFDTTGLAEVDVRIADEHALPQAAERWFTERVVHLPRSSNCFLPPPGAPKVAAAPCTQNGYVTFGLYNQAGKLNRAYLARVAAILRAVPRSRLVLKHAAFGDELVCQRVRRVLASERIDEKRLSFRGKSSLQGYLAAFSEIDVALDPFPYGGETSALHALWMGVPVVALEGDTLATRLGSRVLRVAGLDTWVTRSPDEYVARAIAAAGDRDALVAVRKELRGVLRGSPLLDHVGVTRDLENAYRDAWRAHERARQG